MAATLRRRNKPNARTRARQMQAADLHLSGHTYRDVAKQLNYASESGARAAVQADLRRRAEGVDEKRLAVSARLEKLIGAHWDKATSGTDAGSARVVLQAMTDLSRLWGLDAAQRHLVGVAEVSPQEFARRAAELLAVTGDGPLRELAGLPRAAPVLDDTEPWSNIGPSTAIAAADSPLQQSNAFLAANDPRNR